MKKFKIDTLIFFEKFEKYYILKIMKGFWGM